MKKSGFALGLWAALASTPAAAAEPCLSTSEAEDLTVFLMPSLMEGFARKCSPYLPADAALKTVGPDMARRYRPEADTAWPRAKLAFAKISGKDMPPFLSDEVTRQVMAEAGSAGVINEVPTKDCGLVDRFIDALAPLPPRNMGKLFAILMEVGAKDEKSASASPLRLCATLASR